MIFFRIRRVLSLLFVGLVRAWRYLGGSHRIAKMRYALLLPFAMVHISFGLALYSSAADAKKVGAKYPTSWLTIERWLLPMMCWCVREVWITFSCLCHLPCMRSWCTWPFQTAWALSSWLSSLGASPSW